MREFPTLSPIHISCTHLPLTFTATAAARVAVGYRRRCRCCKPIIITITFRLLPASPSYFVDVVVRLAQAEGGQEEILLLLLLFFQPHTHARIIRVK